MRNWWQRLVNRGLEAQSRSRTQQEEVDIMRAVLAVDYRHTLLARGLEAANEAQPAVYRSVDDARRQVQQAVHTQLANLIRVCGSSRNPGNIVKHSVLQLSKRPSLTTTPAPAVDAGDADNEAAARQQQAAMESLCGYHLSVERSPIGAAAGLGVVLRGRDPCPPGTLLGVYPGVLYRPWQLQELRFVGAEGAPNLFIAIRYDRVAYDAASFRIDNGDSLFASGRPLWLPPYALAHMINHPPAGTRPNVLQTSVYVHASHVEQLVVPHCGVATKPSSMVELVDDSTRQSDVSSMTSTLGMSTSDWIPGLAVLSSSWIHPGEELLLDYRLNPRAKTPLPEWYTPVNVDESRRRWS